MSSSCPCKRENVFRLHKNRIFSHNKLLMSDLQYFCLGSSYFDNLLRQKLTLVGFLVNPTKLQMSVDRKGKSWPFLALMFQRPYTSRKDLKIFQCVHMCPMLNLLTDHRVQLVTFVNFELTIHGSLYFGQKVNFICCRTVITKYLCQSNKS